MKTAITPARLWVIFLGSLSLSLMPVFTGAYIVLTALAFNIFMIVCIVDYFMKSYLRRNFGLILSVMLAALIVSLLIIRTGIALGGN